MMMKLFLFCLLLLEILVVFCCLVMMLSGDTLTGSFWLVYFCTLTYVTIKEFTYEFK